MRRPARAGFRCSWRRVPGAEFLAPKFLVGEDGAPGARNDLLCMSIEHEPGIHASPTAIMSYGDAGGAIAYLIGERNHGLQAMVTMMNHARLNVGLEGVAEADGAGSAHRRRSAAGRAPRSAKARSRSRVSTPSMCCRGRGLASGSDRRRRLHAGAGGGGFLAHSR
jgi:hypothetical protein